MKDLLDILDDENINIKKTDKDKLQWKIENENFQLINEMEAKYIISN